VVIYVRGEYDARRRCKEKAAWVLKITG